MKAVILSAGVGSRLRPLTDAIPKVLLPIGDKPQLYHLLDLCREHHVTKAYLNLYSLKDEIISYLNDHTPPVGVSWVTFPKLVNPADALLRFKNQLDEDFFVLYGDVASTLDLTRVYAFHKKHKAMCTIVLHESSHPQDSDLVEIDASNQVTRIYPKPHPKNVKTNLTNAGTLVVSPRIFRYMKKNSDPLDNLTSSLLIPIVAARVPVYGYVTTDYMKDMGTLERYKAVQKEFPV